MSETLTPGGRVARDNYERSTKEIISRPLVSSSELSKMMKVPKRTLRYWRKNDVGPKWEFWEGIAIYFLDDVQEWRLTQQIRAKNGKKYDIEL